MRSCRYLIEGAGSRKAAFIMVERALDSEARSVAASGGFVDHTSDDVVDERGRKAMGPVGRNL